MKVDDVLARLALAAHETNEALALVGFRRLAERMATESTSADARSDPTNAGIYVSVR